MLFFIVLLFFSQIVYTIPFTRAVAYTVYSATTSDDVVGCQTSASNVTDIVVNLYTIPSVGNYVICVTDELGQASSNLIDIIPAGTDVIIPGNTQFYQIATNFKTSCFYSIYSATGSRWIERIF